MSKVNNVINVLGHYKIPITFVIGVLFLGVLCDHSIIDIIKLDDQKDKLQSELNEYTRQAVAAQKELNALSTSPAAVEKVARERFFMKAADEDVFVLSTTLQGYDNGEKAYGTE